MVLAVGKPFIEAQTSIQAAYLAQRDHADTLEDFAFDWQDCWNRYYEQRLSATEAYYNAQPDGKPVWKLRRLRDAAYSHSERDVAQIQPFRTATTHA